MKNTFSVGESFHEEKYDVFNEEPEEDYQLGKPLQIIWWQGFPIIVELPVPSRPVWSLTCLASLVLSRSHKGTGTDTIFDLGKSSK